MSYKRIFNTILNILIASAIGMSIAYASTNPLSSIESNLDSTTDTIIRIVQVVSVLGLVFYGGYSLFSGNLDKNRIIMIITAILIISSAKAVVETLQDWVK